MRITPLPRPVLKGGQIYLRPVQLSDARERYIGWMNDPEINRFLESRFQVATRENLETYIGQMQNHPDNAFYAVIAADSDSHIGNIKLGPINWEHGSADIGLLIGDKSYWGKGIATEAIRLISEYAFNTLKLHKLAAGCYSNNEGSARAFEKVGFVREGLRKEQFRSNEEYVDQIFLGLVHSNETSNPR